VPPETITKVSKAAVGTFPVTPDEGTTNEEPGFGVIV
jgi:hypothetical protein